MNWLSKSFALISIWPALLLATDSGAEAFKAPFERSTIQLQFDQDGWKLAYKDTNREFDLVEYVPLDEDLGNWSHYLRITRFHRDVLNKDAKKVARALRHELTSRCMNSEALDFEVLEESAGSFFMVWSLESCNSDHPLAFDQHETIRLLQNDQYLFDIAYTVRLGAFNEDENKKWLKSIGEATIVNSIFSKDSKDVVSILSSIPQEQSCRLFDPILPTREKAWLVMTKTQGQGSNASFVPDLRTSGFPDEHNYAVWFINAPEGRIIPIISGLTVSPSGVLVCPEGPPLEPDGPSMLSIPNEYQSDFPLPCVEENAGKSFGEIVKLKIFDYQKGLPIAMGVQSHDGEHIALARAYPRPISAHKKGCSVFMELASGDGRTYILRGNGFYPGEEINVEWSYSKYSEELTGQVSRAGEFALPLFHNKKPRGMNRWKGKVLVHSDHCALGMQYEWGKAGMKN